MINEFKQFEASLISWGITIEDVMGNKIDWHPKLKNNPKGTGYLALIGEKIEIEEFAGFKNLRYYPKNKNHGWTIIFKYEATKTPEKRLKSLKSHIKCNIEFAESIGIDNPQLEAYGILAERLKKLCPKKFDAVLQAFVASNKIDGPIYVCFEIDDYIKYANGVQTEDCLLAINEKMSVVTENGNSDFYGNPDDGWEASSFDAKPSLNFFVFSRNDQNKCYRRYGLNGSAACRMGSKTRSELNRIINIAMSPDKKNDLWFTWQPKKDSQSMFVTISSLSPNNKLMQGDQYDDDLKLEFDEWIEKSNAYLDMLKSQADANPNLQGMVFVLLKPNKGAVSVHYCNTWDGKTIYQAVKGWQTGISLLPTRFIRMGKFLPPNVRGLINALNVEWMMRSKEFESQKIPHLSIEDAYEYLFNNDYAINKINKIIATHHIPMVLECIGNKSLEKTPYELNHIIPICSLALSKAGFTKETAMDHWAFLLGQLFKEANNIHRAYFTSRDMNGPDILIGHRFIRGCYFNPRKALGEFQSAFAIYQHWAESYVNKKLKGATYFSIKNLREILQKLEPLSLEIPTTMKDQERILLAAGYNHFDKKDTNAETQEN